MRPIFFGFFAALLLSLGAGGQSPAGNARVPMTAARIEIRPLPPELTRRFEPLRAALQPAARNWVEEQAKIEARRPHPDLNALRAAIRQRFPRSFSAAGSRQTGVTAVQQSGGDIDAVVFLVLMQASQNAQADLQAQMQQMQAIDQHKQALREIADQLNREVAAGKMSRSSGPCVSAFCSSLPSRFKAVNTASARLPHTVHFQAPSSLTNAQLAALQSQMNSALNTVGDDSQLANIDLQNAMQKQQQALQMISDMEKEMNDTAMSVIRHLGS